MNTILYLVIPCYNEEAVLNETADRLKGKMIFLIERKMISEESKIVFVDDGSKDQTWNMIQKLYEMNKLYSGIQLSRNRGHQNAVLAGILTVKQYADIVITLDADLQDDIDAIDKMIQEYKMGFDIVYGVRSARKTDTFFKRISAESYYKLLNCLGADIVFNHADYRLMSQRVLMALQNYNEVNIFLRGMVPLIGFQSTKIYYERKERFAGESKYPLKKMLSFAWEGITSLSIRPIRFISILGIVVFLISMGMLSYFLLLYFTGNTVTGWASITVSIWALGGIQLFALGIIGEYIGKTYMETKNRPKYIIETFLHSKW